MKKFRKPVKVGNFWSNNDIEWESNGDRNITLSIEEYLKKISPYLSNITYALKNLIQGRLDIKLDWQHQCGVVILSLIVFIYCITNVMK